MKKIFLAFIFLFISSVAFCQNIPQPESWVSDFAGVLTPKEKEDIADLIQALEEKTSVELTVVTISSIGPYDEQGYARRLFDIWSPGKRGKDNGVLILLAVKERLWRIETGYGIEGDLPDGLCGQIGREYMVPYFKTGSYGEGLYQGVLKICNIISGKNFPEFSDGVGKINLIGVFGVICFFVFLGFFLYSSWHWNDACSDNAQGRQSGNYSNFEGGGFGGDIGNGGFGGFGGGLGGGGGAGGRF